MALTIDSQRLSMTDWGNIDKAELRNRLTRALDDSEAGAAEAVREMYLILRSGDLTEAPSINWGFPHHEIIGDALVVNRGALGQAAARLSQGAADGTVTGDALDAAARHLARHYREHDLDVPESVSQMAGLALSTVDKDGPYIISDKPLDMVSSGKRQGFDALGNEHKGFTRAEVESMPRVWMERGEPEIPVDFQDHRSGILSGYIYSMSLEERGGELVLIGLGKWTKQSASAIDAGEINGLSIEVYKNATDRHTGTKHEGWLIERVALASDVFYDDLNRVSLSRSDGFDDAARLFLKLGSQDGDKNMLEALRKLLKLGEKATEKEVEAAVLKLSAFRGKTAEHVLALTGAEPTADLADDALLKSFAEFIAAKKKADEEKVDGNDNNDGSDVAVLRATMQGHADESARLRKEVVDLRTAQRESDSVAFLRGGHENGQIPTIEEATKTWRDKYIKDPKEAELLLSAIKKNPVSVVTGIKGVDTEKVGDDAADALQLRARTIAAEKKIPIDKAYKIAQSEGA